MPQIWRSTRDFWNLRTGKYEWYRVVKNQAGPAEISIYDEISPFGVTAQDFLRDLANVDGPINLRLNSPGGDVYDGIAIYNALAQRKDLVSVYIDGIAASITSVIAMAASPGELSIAKRGQMMIHDAFSMGLGNSSDLRHIADELDRQSDNIAGVYADRTGKPADHWRGQMRSETTYFGQEAVDAGLADKVYEVPQNFGGMFRNANAGWQQRDGKWVFDPDNDGDDDSTAEGDSDHDYWSADGKQLKPIPPNPDGDGGQPLTGDQSGTEARTGTRWLNADKYKQSDRDRMAKSGEAMADGSYPIADSEDLDNAIHAVGRGGADHDSIRAHIIKRADALHLSSMIPDNWNADGSLKSGSSDQLDFQLIASMYIEALEGVK